MTAAERQARRRQRLKGIARRQQQEQMERRAQQPPRGYGRAKEQMIKEGHQFERARRDFGFEEGVFVDGAFLDSYGVIDLATLPLQQRQQRIAERRASEKQFACEAVQGYMERLHVSLDDLLGYFEERAAIFRRGAEMDSRRIKKIVQGAVD